MTQTTNAEIVWIYCDRRTGEPMRSPTNRKILVHSEKPSYANLAAYGSQRQKNVIARKAILAFCDEVENA